MIATTEGRSPVDDPTIRHIQRALVNRGLFLGTTGPNKDGVDGDLGFRTKEALKLFQRMNELPVTGMPDSATIAVLLEVGQDFRRPFFDALRKTTLFPKGFTQRQVDGINRLLTEANARGITDPRLVAYPLATTFHETNQMMWPVKEKGSGDGPDADPWDDYLEYLDTRTDLGHSAARDGDHVPFIGKGDVQITGKSNYEKFRPLVLARFGVDIMKDTDAVLRPDISAFILFEGMLKGMFTGKKMGDFISATKTDFYNARTVVNRLDRALDIARYADIFLKALEAAPYILVPEHAKEEPYDPVPAPVKPKPIPVLPEPAEEAPQSWWQRFLASIGIGSP
jgi:putative chitinase